MDKGLQLIDHHLLLTVAGAKVGLSPELNQLEGVWCLEVVLGHLGNGNKKEFIDETRSQAKSSRRHATTTKSPSDFFSQ